ncbi:MAG: efflux RND transporter permease subunit [Gammaproteobacteria bacterium]|nr:efflux RND transporter permease subunit [Gammaproteobacteria bacterium]
MNGRFRTGGLASWAVRRPVAVCVLATAIVAPGLLSLWQLNVDLLPDLIYPTVHVRVMNPGVSARIMEDQVTRQVEEQLSVTEGAVDVQSFTQEGRSAVDLFFPYGTDINAALRDASTRLDRAKRQLPTDIEPPSIYKRDPSQAPVMELVVSSGLRDTTELYEWVDYLFARNFVNLPGVAAAEVGGGSAREIDIEVDQERLSASGLTFGDIAEAVTAENRDATGGQLLTARSELSTRVVGRAKQAGDLRHIPLEGGADSDAEDGTRADLSVGDIAHINDGLAREQLRIRLNDRPGVKVTIRKQPQANTVAVVDNVTQHLAWMRENRLIPSDVQVHVVNDQSVFVRHALRNAASAAGLGGLLAMTVVYLFLGNLKRTLIVGTSIPLALLVTFLLMQLAGLSLNIMTLGGLALGIGILVDSTIVMLENIYRHQRAGEASLDDAIAAAREVNSPIVASTTTNLAAVLPFVFIGGLMGLLFRELIFTISAAIFASMVVALTLVPTLAARVRDTRNGAVRRLTERVTHWLQLRYERITLGLLRAPWLPALILLPALAWAIHFVSESEKIFLPSVDEGQVRIRVKGDAGMQLEETDAIVRRLESALREQPEVDTVFVQSGGWVYGRIEVFTGNRATISVQLVPPEQRTLSTRQWVEHFMETVVDPMELTGVHVWTWVRDQVRGIRVGSGEEDLNLRIAGPDLATLTRLADDAVERLKGIPGLRNLRHSYDTPVEELDIVLDRARASDLGVSIDDISRAVRVALDGIVVSDFYDGDRKIDVRLRLPPDSIDDIDDLGNVVVALRDGKPVRIRHVARIDLVPAPARIFRDRQVRAAEISANLTGDRPLDTIMAEARDRLDDLPLPPGYTLYDDGALETLKKGQQLGFFLLALALFLVFVVMAVQYESLVNPLVILTSVPFALIGVSSGLWYNGLPLSMPVWLGMIMLAGIVVNNAIVLVEQIEIELERGASLNRAIAHAAYLRLRPILMTTLTTVAGMAPLAMGIGEGSEMLQPLAVVIVWGLSFSMFVTLVLVPTIFRMLHGGLRQGKSAIAPLTD